MLHALVAEAAQQTEETHGAGLPSPYVFGIVALCVLASLLIVTVAFRSVGTRH
ncbi:hypothetical protein AB2L27_05720 [Kineococcus sp. LSe6-4]|uniref:Uncharacterized protein n=1 Tax=Kineococcus halophytocola TaxID=3234027 RepID=A0ABV4GY78_9ACTN